MTDPADRIRALVDAGKISRAEGDRLLRAMSERKPSSSALELLLNPFARFGGGVAAASGLVLSTLAVGTTRFGVHYDGFLDLHVGHDTIPISRAVLEQVAAWLVPAGLFWIASLVMGGHRRILDFIGMTGLSRLSYVLLAVPLALVAPPPSEELTVRVAIVMVVALFAVGTNLTWLYQGFKNASGLHGVKLLAVFITMLIAAEVASKAVLAL